MCMTYSQNHLGCCFKTDPFFYDENFQPSVGGPPLKTQKDAIKMAAHTINTE